MNDLRTDVLAALTEAGEDGLTLPALSTALGMPKSTIQPVLTELVSRLTIRSTQGLRNVRYWIPSEARLKSEEAANQVRIVPPLKVSKERRELYDRINAERLSIPSIG